jgi:hypothetical protein
MDFGRGTAKDNRALIRISSRSLLAEKKRRGGANVRAHPLTLYLVERMLPPSGTTAPPARKLANYLYCRFSRNRKSVCNKMYKKYIIWICHNIVRGSCCQKAEAPWFRSTPCQGDRLPRCFWDPHLAKSFRENTCLDHMSFFLGHTGFITEDPLNLHCTKYIVSLNQWEYRWCSGNSGAGPR